MGYIHGFLQAIDQKNFITLEGSLNLAFNLVSFKFLALSSDPLQNLTWFLFTPCEFLNALLPYFQPNYSPILFSFLFSLYFFF